MRGTIILTQPMELMTTAQQEEIWRLSRTNDVYIRDINDELWQVLDLTNDDTDTSMLAVKSLGMEPISHDIGDLSDAKEQDTKTG